MWRDTFPHQDSGIWKWRPYFTPKTRKAQMSDYTKCAVQSLWKRIWHPLAELRRDQPTSQQAHPWTPTPRKPAHTWPGRSVKNRALREASRQQSRVDPFRWGSRTGETICADRRWNSSGLQGGHWLEGGRRGPSGWWKWSTAGSERWLLQAYIPSSKLTELYT